ncbi:hypothetical protein JT358_07875 [Micrococcales bacterium 31B]|nr:hypothetical protein [Micrococcales bacterium 31B]
MSNDLQEDNVDLEVEVAETEAVAEVADSADASEDADDSAEGRGERTSLTIEQLEEEGDIAADYLEELLDIVDLDGDIDIDVEGGRASIAILNDDTKELKLLVGRNGEVLEALQELTRLAVQTKTGYRSRLMLDIAGHRTTMRSRLKLIAENAIESVRANGEPVHLDPMNPFERKVIHDAIAAAGLVSDSEGTDSNRHVVVFPADK